MPLTISAVINALMIASVFSGGVLISIGGVTTNLAPIFAVLAIIVYAYAHKLTIKKSILLLCLMVAAHGLILLAIGLTSLFLFLKTYLAAVVLYWGFSLAINQSGGYEFVLRAYIVGASVIAAIGMVQAIGWLIGLSPLYDYSWISGWKFAPGGLLGMRLNSILYEPSQVAFTMGPAACIALYRITGKMKDLMRLRTAVVIMALAVFSGSSTMYVVFGLFLSIMLFSSKTFAVRYSVFMLLAIFAVSQTAIFDSTINKFNGLVETFGGADGENISSTTFTLYFHYQTAVDNFLRSNFLGGGIGSHEILTNSMLASNVFDHMVYNANSAGNLTYRLLSEFGVFGIGLMVGFAVYVLRGTIHLSRDQLVVHAALATGILGFFIRNGTYAQYGLALFVLLLLQNGRHRGSNRSKLASSRHPFANGLTNGQGGRNSPAVSTVHNQNTSQ